MHLVVRNHAIAALIVHFQLAGVSYASEGGEQDPTDNRLPFETERVESGRDLVINLPAKIVSAELEGEAVEDGAYVLIENRSPMPILLKYQRAGISYASEGGEQDPLDNRPPFDTLEASPWQAIRVEMPSKILGVELMGIGVYTPASDTGA
jgi:hypothetical protein